MYDVMSLVQDGVNTISHDIINELQVRCIEQFGQYKLANVVGALVARNVLHAMEHSIRDDVVKKVAYDAIVPMLDKVYDDA